MALDDILKGVAALNSGLTELAVNRAANDAHEEIQKINSMELDRKAQLEATARVGQQLALRLQASGADAAQIAATAERLAPSAGSLVQIEAQKDLQGSSQAFEKEKQTALFAQQKELQQMKNDALIGKAGAKAGKEKLGFIQKNQSAFESAAKKPLEALNALRIAKDAVNSNNPIADKSVANFLVRASGDVGNITEAERGPFEGSTDIKSRIKQTLENMKNGKFTPENRKLVKHLIGVYENRHKANILETRNRIAARAAETAQNVGYELDANQLADMIYKDPDQAAALPTSSSTQTITPPQSSVPVNPINKYLTPVK